MDADLETIFLDANKKIQSIIKQRSCSPKQPGNLIDSTKSKKRVMFSDNVGMPLEEIRLIPSRKCFTHFRVKLQSSYINLWKIANFEQPRNYALYRKKLNSNQVVLKTINNTDKNAQGTVEVMNFSAGKEVFVRYTFDDWKSFQDLPCTIRNNNLNRNYYSLYETFWFSFEIPFNSSRIEFCICYRAEHCEYWENNNHQNFALIKDYQFYQ